MVSTIPRARQVSNTCLFTAVNNPEAPSCRNSSNLLPELARPPRAVPDRHARSRLAVGSRPSRGTGIQGATFRHTSRLAARPCRTDGGTPTVTRPAGRPIAGGRGRASGDGTSRTSAGSM